MIIFPFILILVLNSCLLFIGIFKKYCSLFIYSIASEIRVGFIISSVKFMSLFFYSNLAEIIHFSRLRKSDKKKKQVETQSIRYEDWNELREITKKKKKKRRFLWRDNLCDLNTMKKIWRALSWKSREDYESSMVRQRRLSRQGKRM